MYVEKRYHEATEPLIDEDGLVHGVVRRAYPNGVIFLEDDNGLDYFALKQDAIIPGGHTCLLEERTPVSFAVQPNPKRKDQWQAFDITLESPVEINLIGEESTVSQWNPSIGGKAGFGFSSRDCGCEIYINSRNILSDLARELRVGDRIRHNTVRKNGGRQLKWVAADIDVFVPDSEIQKQ